MYKIESGIPIPPVARSRKTYPFCRMSVGDSFQVSKDAADRAYSSAYAYGRKKNQRYSIRRNGTTARIWRVQ